MLFKYPDITNSSKIKNYLEAIIFKTVITRHRNKTRQISYFYTFYNNIALNH